MITFFASEVLAQYDESTSSSEIGLTASYYRYEEPNFMNIKATNIGLDYIGTLALNDNWFIRGDFIFTASGGTRYSSNGTGTMDNFPNCYVDIRPLFGRNLAFENSTLAPYMGLGYRYLYHDGRGTTSTGNPGYRRESNYLYLPVGFMHKMDLTEQSKLITTIEFDCLLLGKQISRESDINTLNSDITNTQKFGYGARLLCMYRFNNWAIGPFLTYWHIDNSEIVSAKVIDKNNIPTGENIYFIEPKNHTIEAGLKISYRF